MAKTRTSKRTRQSSPARAHRVNTVKGNGSLPESREVAPARRGRPRQQDLPGTEDRAIKPLEDIAAAYADARDRRMELNQEEHELKQTALKLMKKFDKTIYRHDGIEIRVVPGEEDVKVKVKKPGDDDDDEADTDATDSDRADGVEMEVSE